MDNAPQEVSQTKANLDRSLVHGIAWTGAVTWGSQIISWGATFFVIRHLQVEDYGMVGTAFLYLGLVQMFSEFGVGAAVVRFQKLTSAQIAQFNGLSVLLGLSAFALSLALAKPVGWYFEQPRLPVLIVVMSVSFVVTSFRVVPQALMQRDLRFRTLAAIEGIQSVSAAAANVTMAALGFGMWTLALGPLVGATVFMVLIVSRTPTPFKWPNLDAIRQPFHFSKQTLLTRFAWYGYSNADFFVVRKTLGERALGAYTVGWTISGIAVEKITSLVGRVTPAFFSAVQDNLVGLRRYLLLLTEGLSLLTFPACVGLALVGDDLVPFALGEQWALSTTPLRLLALLACVRSIEPLVQQVVAAIGEAQLNLNNSVLTVCVLPFGFYGGATLGAALGGASGDPDASLAGGVTGVAIAWLILDPLFFGRLLFKALAKIELPARQYFAALWPALSGCLVMSGVVLLMDMTLLSSAPVHVSLFAKIAAGAVAYVATLFVLHRERLLMARKFVNMLRTHRTPEASPQAQAIDA